MRQFSIIDPLMGAAHYCGEARGSCLGVFVVEA